VTGKHAVTPAPFQVDHRDAPAAARPPKRDELGEAWAELTTRERKQLANRHPRLAHAIVTHLDQGDAS